MDNPVTILEKVDAAANLVEQMNLAHMIKDEAQFKKAHARASHLLFEVINMIDEDENIES